MIDPPAQLCATTWQTVGPYFRIGLEPLYTADIARDGATGQRIVVEGRILDGDGQPIPDAVIEIWQADASGRYAQPDDHRDLGLKPGFCGFGRIPAGEDGSFRFTTIKPGAVHDGLVGRQAPHLVVTVMMRGLLRSLVTRAYFADDPLNSSDPILKLVPHERRATLLLQPSAEDPSAYRWAIHMQGSHETVFFDF